MTDSRLNEQLEALQDIGPAGAMLPAAIILRNASYYNYTGLDPDAPEDEFTNYPTDEGAEVQALEDNFNIADVEYGTGPVNFPFMRPAIDDNMDAMLSAVHDNIQEQIKNIIK